SPTAATSPIRSDRIRRDGGMAMNSISRHSSLAPLLVICGLGAFALDARAGRLDGSARDPGVLAAVALVRTHAEAGDDVAQLTLAEYLLHAGSRSEAVAWYLRAADAGHRD